MKKNTRRQSKGSIKTFRFVLFIGTAVTLVLILLIIILGDQQFGPVHKIIFEGVGPLQKTMSTISDSLHSVKKNYIELLTVREEKERLWQELQECRSKAYANRGAVAGSVIRCVATWGVSTRMVRNFNIMKCELWMPIRSET